jgi:hypothetical protein
MAKQEQSRYKSRVGLYRQPLSPQYRTWRAAVSSHGASSDAAKAAACAHWEKFGFPIPHTAVKRRNYPNPCRV